MKDEAVEHEHTPAGRHRVAASNARVSAVSVVLVACAFLAVFALALLALQGR